MLTRRLCVSFFSVKRSAADEVTQQSLEKRIKTDEQTSSMQLAAAVAMVENINEGECINIALTLRRRITQALAHVLFLTVVGWCVVQTCRYVANAPNAWCRAPLRSLATLRLVWK